MDCETNKEYTPPQEWDKITDSEKIERMREIIKNLQRQVSNTTGEINKTRNSFKNHSHLDGKIVVPYNEYSDNVGLGTVTGKSSGNNFF